MPIKINRPFDIRRVQNSETQVRLSMDVPPHVSSTDLEVQMEEDKDQEDIYILRIAGPCTTKCFSLTAESIDLASIKVTLYDNHVLEIVAYKTSTTSTNPFQMVADAFQSFTLNTWSSHPNKILRRIPIIDMESKDSMEDVDMENSA
jgi:hypothetical protein